MKINSQRVALSFKCYMCNYEIILRDVKPNMRIKLINGKMQCNLCKGKINVGIFKNS